MVVPKSWDYIRVPVQVNVENELRSLNKLQTFLAPWKFCDETKLNPDSLPDTIESIVKQTQVAKCKNCSELRCIRSYLVFSWTKSKYFGNTIPKIERFFWGTF